MHYNYNKFSKIAKRWPQRRLSSILLTWSRVICPNCSFSDWLWRNRKNLLWRHFTDVIVIALPKNVTKTKVTRFSHSGPFPIKIFRYAIGCNVGFAPFLASP